MLFYYWVGVVEGGPKLNQHWMNNNNMHILPPPSFAWIILSEENTQIWPAYLYNLENDVPELLILEQH